MATTQMILIGAFFACLFAAIFFMLRARSFIKNQLPDIAKKYGLFVENNIWYVPPNKDEEGLTADYNFSTWLISIEEKKVIEENSSLKLMLRCSYMFMALAALFFASLMVLNIVML